MVASPPSTTTHALATDLLRFGSKYRIALAPSFHRNIDFPRSHCGTQFFCTGTQQPLSRHSCPAGSRQGAVWEHFFSAKSAAPACALPGIGFLLALTSNPELPGSNGEDRLTAGSGCAPSGRWTSKGPPAATAVNNSRIVVQRSEPTSLRTAPLRKGHFRY